MTPLSLWPWLIKPARPTMAQIAAAVARKHGLDAGDLLARCRKAPLVRARNEAMARMRAGGRSYRQIASFFGMKDHTSALHGVRKHLGGTQ